MSEPRQVAVVINPVKNHADEARGLVRAQASALGWPEPLFFETEEDDPGHSMAKAALDAGATLIVAAGGDGTVRAVAAALIGHGGIHLAILPRGTGNLLARNLGINVDEMETAAHTALNGPTEPLDALRIRASNRGSEPQEHTSLVATGVGLDAEVMLHTNEKLKKVVGPAAYAAAAVGKIFGHRYQVRISVNDGPWTTERVRTVLFANAGYIQGGIEFAQGARLDDGTQQAMVVTARDAWDWSQVAVKALLRPSKRVSALQQLEGTTIRVRPFYPLAAQVDGDPIGMVTDLESTVLPSALTVRVPAEHHRTAPGGSMAQLLPAELAPTALVAEGKKQARRFLRGK